MKKNLFLFAFLFLIEGCVFDPWIPGGERKLPDSADVRMEFVAPKAEYYVGEGLGFEISIRNNAKKSVYFPGICEEMYEFSFTDPSEFHLIDPDGEDLMRAFYQSDLNEYPCSSLVVDPGEEEDIDLYLSQLFYLMKPGRYSLNAKLVDTDGKEYGHEPFGFELLPAVQAIPTQGVSLTLTSPNVTLPITTLDQLHGSGVVLTATFANGSDSPIILFRPNSLSYSFCSNPLYKLNIVESESGRGLIEYASDGCDQPEISRSALFARWAFIIDPGESQSVAFPLLIYPMMWREPGTYRVRLTYIVYENKIRYGRVLDVPELWPSDVFTGMLESNEVLITVEDRIDNDG